MHYCLVCDVRVQFSASRAAVAQAFAAGLSIVVAKNGKLVRIAPDGTDKIASRYSRSIAQLKDALPYFPVRMSSTTAAQ